jgi:hypothetical protein
VLQFDRSSFIYQGVADDLMGVAKPMQSPSNVCNPKVMNLQLLGNGLMFGGHCLGPCLGELEDLLGRRNTEILYSVFLTI